MPPPRLRHTLITMIMKIELTTKEWGVVYSILNNVNNIMSYDEDMEAYTDGGNFVCSLDKEELKALRRVLKKL